MVQERFDSINQTSAIKLGLFAMMQVCRPTQTTYVNITSSTANSLSIGV